MDVRLRRSIRIASKLYTLWMRLAVIPWLKLRVLWMEGTVGFLLAARWLRSCLR